MSGFPHPRRSHSASVACGRCAGRNGANHIVSAKSPGPGAAPPSSAQATAAPAAAPVDTQRYKMIVMVLVPVLVVLIAAYMMLTSRSALVPTWHSAVRTIMDYSYVPARRLLGSVFSGFGSVFSGVLGLSGAPVSSLAASGYDLGTRLIDAIMAVSYIGSAIKWCLLFVKWVVVSLVSYIVSLRYANTIVGLFSEDIGLVCRYPRPLLTLTHTSAPLPLQSGTSCPSAAQAHRGQWRSECWRARMCAFPSSWPASSDTIASASHGS